MSVRKSEAESDSVAALCELGTCDVEVGSSLRKCVRRLGVEDVLRSTEVLIASRGDDASPCAVPVGSEAVVGGVK